MLDRVTNASTGSALAYPSQLHVDSHPPMPNIAAADFHFVLHLRESIVARHKGRRHDRHWVTRASEDRVHPAPKLQRRVAHVAGQVTVFVVARALGKAVQAR